MADNNAPLLILKHEIQGAPEVDSRYIPEGGIEMPMFSVPRFSAALSFASQRNTIFAAGTKPAISSSSDTIAEGRRLIYSALLAKFGVAAELSSDDRRVLTALLSATRTIAPHRDIVRQGQTPQRVHFILDGWAACYQTLPDGSRQIVAFLLPGDVCDMGAGVLSNSGHSVCSLTDVTIVSIDPAALAEAMNNLPQVAAALNSAKYIEAATLRAWIVNLGRRDAYARMAHLFCELNVRLRQSGLASHGSFRLPITQDTLADAVGLTPVHTNRILGRLRTTGLIRLQNQSCTILDEAGLTSAAGFDAGYLEGGAHA